ncbi:hypothetical protein TNCV_3524331 [Trichonephila clavipes]|uniref:Uncharacterized protein n=1 Tax=Trichonephila clavipes TaxID=2585209 RepID=A0A8X6V6E7_TRICX|nr:hypothetical protein TNCV_3524331 [Trichonephila clavipes]
MMKIRNRLQEVQLWAQIPETRVSTSLNRARHMEWCHRHGTWTIKWHRVSYTDDSRFSQWRNDGRRRVWRTLRTNSFLQASNRSYTEHHSLRWHNA